MCFLVSVIKLIYFHCFNRNFMRMYQSSLCVICLLMHNIFPEDANKADPSTGGGPSGRLSSSSSSSDSDSSSSSLSSSSSDSSDSEAG